MRPRPSPVRRPPAAARHGAGDRLVYGHTHRASVSDDGLTANPGAWVADGGESRTYLRIEDDRVTLRRFGRDPFP